jgi:hypothetical protein
MVQTYMGVMVHLEKLWMIKTWSWKQYFFGGTVWLGKYIHEGSIVVEVGLGWARF